MAAFDPQEKSIVTTHEQVPQISRPGASVPGRSMPSASAAGMTGKEILGAIRRRIWLIVICASVTTFLVLVGTFAWDNTSPLYTSDAILAVNPPKAGPTIGNMDVTPREIMDRLGNQAVRIVSSDEVMRKVLDAREIKETKWFQRERDTDANLRRLQKEVSISFLPSEGAIRISMMGMDKNEITRIVNQVANTAIDVSRKITQDRFNNLVTGYRTRLDEDQKSRENLQQKLASLRPADIPMFEKQQSALSIRIQRLTDEMVQKEVEQSGAESKLKGFSESSDNEKIAQAQATIEQDATLRALLMQQASYQTERDNAVSKYGPLHRRVADLEARLRSVDRQVEQTKAEVTSKAILQVKGFFESQVGNIKQELIDLRGQMDLTTTSMKGLEDTLQKVNALQIDIKNLEDKMKDEGQKLADINLLSEQERTINIQIRATVPIDPTWPNYWVFITVGAILGLAIGFGLVFLLEFMDTSVKSSADITRRVDLPVLGIIPHSDDLEEEIGDLRLAFASNPNSLVGEAFRQIRTCLLFSGPASQRRSLLITSAQPEDGRTTVAVNLAAAIAHGGRKVLVLDANFRQPAIRKLFPQCKEAGLSNVLVGQGGWQELVCQIEPNLWVLSSGPLPPNPAELLGSEAMRQLITELAAQYDQIIFDGAPLLVVSDSRILATVVDGVVLVVRAGANTYGIVTRAREMLVQTGSRIIGVALNGVRATAGGYLRKSYETFYDYHQQVLPGGQPPQA